MTRKHRVRAATGHIVGVRYYSAYWGHVYDVLSAHPDGTVSVRTVGEDEIRRHRTQLSYGKDHPVSQPCDRHNACRLRKASTVKVG